MHAQEETTYNKFVSKGNLSVCFKNIYKYMHECNKHMHTDMHAFVTQIYP